MLQSVRGRDRWTTWLWTENGRKRVTVRNDMRRRVVISFKMIDWFVPFWRLEWTERKDDASSNSSNIWRREKEKHRSLSATFFHFFFHSFISISSFYCLRFFASFPPFFLSKILLTFLWLFNLFGFSHNTDKPEFPSSNGTSMSIFDVVEGSDDFEIHLPAKGNPPLIHYFWSKDAISLANNKRIHMNSSTLLIRQVTRDDAGVYSVRAANTEGSSNTSFQLNVLCKCIFLLSCVIELLVFPRIDKQTSLIP